MTLGAVALCAGCGSAPAGTDAGSAPSSSAAASAPATPAGEPTASGEPYVPGSPDNEVRPATRAERAAWPTCDEVWRGDGSIPGRYRGCVDGDRAVVADRIPCSFGGSMTTYADRYYGVLGNVVNDAGESLSTSRRYARAHALCTG